LGDHEPPLDSMRYRQAMGLFATGVAVLAVRAPDSGVLGMTANAITSLSLEPLLLLVCVEKIANIAPALLQAEGFTLNFLSEPQAPLSDYFAGRWQADPHAFSFTDWGGGPLLDGCLATIGCRTHSVVEGGDHWILQGKVIAVHLGEGRDDPLMFFASRYQRLKPGQGVSD
jgi:flavin reductase (DIM6/NTAB) family NADH-FMN oxidoreductase RutF